MDCNYHSGWSLVNQVEIFASCKMLIVKTVLSMKFNVLVNWTIAICDAFCSMSDRDTVRLGNDLRFEFLDYIDCDNDWDAIWILFFNILTFCVTFWTFMTFFMRPQESPMAGHRQNHRRSKLWSKGIRPCLRQRWVELPCAPLRALVELPIYIVIQILKFWTRWEKSRMEFTFYLLIDTNHVVM